MVIRSCSERFLTTLDYAGHSPLCDVPLIHTAIRGRLYSSLQVTGRHYTEKTHSVFPFYYYCMDPSKITGKIISIFLSFILPYLYLLPFFSIAFPRLYFFVLSPFLSLRYSTLAR
jgi:hypothetical protein